MLPRTCVWTCWRRSKQVYPLCCALHSPLKLESSFIQIKCRYAMKKVMQEEDAQSGKIIAAQIKDGCTGLKQKDRKESTAQCHGPFKSKSAADSKSGNKDIVSFRASKSAHGKKEKQYTFQSSTSYHSFQAHSKAKDTTRFKQEHKSNKSEIPQEGELKSQTSGKFLKDETQRTDFRKQKKHKRQRKDSVQDETRKERKLIASLIEEQYQKEVPDRSYQTKRQHHKSHQSHDQRASPFRRWLSLKDDPLSLPFEDIKNPSTLHGEFKPRKNITQRNKVTDRNGMIPAVAELFRQHSTKISLNSNAEEHNTEKVLKGSIASSARQNIAPPSTVENQEYFVNELEDGEIVDDEIDNVNECNEKEQELFHRRNSCSDVEIVECISDSPGKDQEIHSGHQNFLWGKRSQNYHRRRAYKRSAGKHQPGEVYSRSDMNIYCDKHIRHKTDRKSDKVSSAHDREQPKYIMEEDWDVEILKVEQELSVLKSEGRKTQGEGQSVSTTSAGADEMSISSDDDTGKSECGEIEYVNYSLSSSKKNTGENLSEKPVNADPVSPRSNSPSIFLPSLSSNQKGKEFCIGSAAHSISSASLQVSQSIQDPSSMAAIQSFYTVNPINMATGFRPTPHVSAYMNLLHQAVQIQEPLLSSESLSVPNRQYSSVCVNQGAWVDKGNSNITSNNTQWVREHKTKTSKHKTRIHFPAGLVQSCPEINNTPRKWHQVQAVAKSPGEMEFTVMSYNILSQDLMEQHPDLYYKCRDSDLQWQNRGAALIRQIIAHNSDIVCLQEVQEDLWMVDIKSNMERYGYDSVYKKRYGDKPDGCAILYKRDKFEQLKFVPVDFMRGGILDRYNIGIILLLTPKKEFYSGEVKKICVATTHLLFNPRRGDIKLAQLMILLAEIDKYANQGKDVSLNEGGKEEKNNFYENCLDDTTSKQQLDSFKKEKQLSTFDSLLPESGTQKPEAGQSVHQLEKTFGRGDSSDYCPIIMCGDFNSEPFSDLYKFITKGKLKYEGLISRLVCGQREGQSSGSNRQLVRQLLPRQLSISEDCQYTDVMRERQKGIAKVSPGEPGYVLKVNSGNVFHKMNLCSVYRHFVDGPGPDVREVSTHHMKSTCTVDYIFYSCNNPRKFEDSKGGKSVSEKGESGSSVDPSDSKTSSPTLKEPLLLVERYRLLSTKEVAKTGCLPNSTFPSDHLCLIGKFLLR